MPSAMNSMPYREAASSRRGASAATTGAAATAAYKNADLAQEEFGTVQAPTVPARAASVLGSSTNGAHHPLNLLQALRLISSTSRNDNNTSSGACSAEKLKPVVRALRLGGEDGSTSPASCRPEDAAAATSSEAAEAEASEYAVESRRLLGPHTEEEEKLEVSHIRSNSRTDRLARDAVVMGTNAAGVRLAVHARRFPRESSRVLRETVAETAERRSSNVSWLDDVMPAFLSDSRVKRFILQAKALADRQEFAKLDELFSEALRVYEMSSIPAVPLPNNTAGASPPPSAAVALLLPESQQLRSAPLPTTITTTPAAGVVVSGKSACLQLNSRTNTNTNGASSTLASSSLKTIHSRLAPSSSSSTCSFSSSSSSSASSCSSCSVPSPAVGVDANFAAEKAAAQQTSNFNGISISAECNNRRSDRKDFCSPSDRNMASSSLTFFQQREDFDESAATTKTLAANTKTEERVQQNQQEQQLNDTAFLCSVSAEKKHVQHPVQKKNAFFLKEAQISRDHAPDDLTAIDFPETASTSSPVAPATTKTTTITTTTKNSWTAKLTSATTKKNATTPNLDLKSSPATASCTASAATSSWTASKSSSLTASASQAPQATTRLLTTPDMSTSKPLAAVVGNKSEISAPIAIAGKNKSEISATTAIAGNKSNETSASGVAASAAASEGQMSEAATAAVSAIKKSEVSAASGGVCRLRSSESTTTEYNNSSSNKSFAPIRSSCSSSGIFADLGLGLAGFHSSSSSSEDRPRQELEAEAHNNWAVKMSTFEVAVCNRKVQENKRRSGLLQEESFRSPEETVDSLSKTTAGDEEEEEKKAAVKIHPITIVEEEAEVRQQQGGGVGTQRVSGVEKQQFDGQVTFSAEKSERKSSQPLGVSGGGKVELGSFSTTAAGICETLLESRRRASDNSIPPSASSSADEDRHPFQSEELSTASRTDEADASKTTKNADAAAAAVAQLCIKRTATDGSGKDPSTFFGARESPQRRRRIDATIRSAQLQSSQQDDTQLEDALQQRRSETLQKEHRKVTDQPHCSEGHSEESTPLKDRTMPVLVGLDEAGRKNNLELQKNEQQAFNLPSNNENERNPQNGQTFPSLSPALQLLSHLRAQTDRLSSAPPPQLDEETLRILEGVFSKQKSSLVESVEIFEEEVVLPLLGLGEYMSRTLFSLIDRHNTGTISLPMLKEFWRGRLVLAWKDPSFSEDFPSSAAKLPVFTFHAATQRDEATGVMYEEVVQCNLQRGSVLNFFNVVKQPRNAYIKPEDLRPWIHEILQRAPDMAFLNEPTAAEFSARYVDSVVARIMFDVDVEDTGRITLKALKRSCLVHVWCTLNPSVELSVIRRFFSYEHFYVFYCTFHALDEDEDFLLDRTDVRRYDNHSLSLAVEERLFSEVVQPFRSPKPGYMCFDDWIWFLLVYHDVTSERAIEFWFKIFDIDGDGVLRDHEIEGFFNAQAERFRMRSDKLPTYSDFICPMCDALRVPHASGLRCRDLLRDRICGAYFINCLLKQAAFQAMDDGETMNSIVRGSYDRQLLPDWTPFDIYAHAEYIILTAKRSEECFIEDSERSQSEEASSNENLEHLDCSTSSTPS